MRPRKMPPYALEVGRLLMLDAEQLGGRCQMLENRKIVRTTLPLFPSARFTRSILYLRSFQERIYLSAGGASAVPNCSCRRIRYREGVGHLSLRIREVLYRRSEFIRKHVVLLVTFMPPRRRSCRSEGESRPSLVVGQFISESESAPDKACEDRGRYGAP
jgi:hypothetical protein